MRFRLIYEGELRSSQKDAVGEQTDRLAGHKQSIRKVFHRQLRELWKTNWFLSTHRVWPKDYGAGRHASDTDARWAASDAEKLSLRDAVISSHLEHGYRFVPLVRGDWKLVCDLQVLFLRYDTPGSVISAGDLDNRLKTLIDGLRKPANAGELHGNEAPASDEDPFYCLLEDDKLVAGLSVESDRLLKPARGKTDADRRWVHVVVTVNVRPYDVTSFNLSFAGT